MSLASVNLHSPDSARHRTANGVHWLVLSLDGDTAAVFTTEARAAAMAFAFNNPAAVLALISDDPVTIVEEVA